MNFYIIHLERDRNRKANVSKLSEKLPGRINIINAIDGRELSEDYLEKFKTNKYFPPYPFKLRNTEIACFLSHRKAWEEIIKFEDEGAVIMEDDVEIDEILFNNSLEIIKNYSSKDDFIRLPYKNRENPRKIFAKHNDAFLIRPKVIGLGMQCQFVGVDAAKKLLNNTIFFDRPVDTTLQMFWVTKIEPKAILPSGISEISGQVGGTSIHSYEKIYKKLFREIIRPLYRFIFYIISSYKTFFRS